MPFTLRPLKTVDDALRHFIQALDLEMVELLLKVKIYSGVWVEPLNISKTKGMNN